MNLKKRKFKITICILLTVILFVWPGTGIYAESYGYTKALSDITFADYGRITCIHLGPEDNVLPYYYDAFIPSQMHKLAAFEVDEGNSAFTAYSGCLYNKDKTMLICFPQALRGAAIPNSCVSILPQALKGTSSSIRRQVKAAITKNNGGVWPGYYRDGMDSTNKNRDTTANDPVI